MSLSGWSYASALLHLCGSKTWRSNTVQPDFVLTSRTSLPHFLHGFFGHSWSLMGVFLLWDIEGCALRETAEEAPRTIRWRAARQAGFGGGVGHKNQDSGGGQPNGIRDGRINRPTAAFESSQIQRSWNSSLSI